MHKSEFASGGRLPGSPMRRVDHYDRQQILMPNGKFMCSYTPVFVSGQDASEVEASSCESPSVTRE